MEFDIFVLPFTIGLIVLLIILCVKYISWLLQLNEDQKKAVRTNLFTFRTLKGIREIISESLLHRNIFRKNRLLGYMHMSLAFGWFLLIVAGHFESYSFFHTILEAPYVPIFLRFFQMDSIPDPTSNFYWFIMDFLLLFVLSGVALAWFKRFNNRRFGMKRTTSHLIGDRIALSVLWLIFPLRLAAESITSAIYGGGSFLTAGIGSLLENNIASDFLFHTAWWAYSFSLGLFFVSLPFSRYMHIPTEAVLIMLRNWGAVSSICKMDGIKRFEINSCSSCGICLDTCQLMEQGISNIQSPYIFRNFRQNSTTDKLVQNCLMCGRCETDCVVGIRTTNNRLAIRDNKDILVNHEYLNRIEVHFPDKPDVLYFAGCMSHLTPGIKKSMISVFKAAGINFAIADEDQSICCGRPMMLTGLRVQANVMIQKNTGIFNNSGASMLVTSCPICYKVFKEDYNLHIEILHHTQLIDRLMAEGKLVCSKTEKRVVYHDPCELGRSSGIYREPRNILNTIANLSESSYRAENALCCGGSIGNSILTSGEKRNIARLALAKIVPDAQETLITACPLCKKTFSSAQSGIQILDIAELVDKCLTSKPKVDKQHIYETVDSENITM